MSSLLKEAIVDAKALREAALKSAETTIVEKYSDEVRQTLEKLLEQDDLGADLGADLGGDMGGDLGGDMGADPMAAAPLGAEGEEGEPEEIVDNIPLAATDGLADAEGDGLSRLPEEGENVEFNVDLDTLQEAVQNLQAEIDNEEYDFDEKLLSELLSETELTEEEEKEDEDPQGSGEMASGSGQGPEGQAAQTAATHEEDEDLKMEEELDLDIDSLTDAITEKLTVDMGATLSGWAGRSSFDQKWEMEKEMAHRRSTDVEKDLEKMRKAYEELVFENKQLSEHNNQYKQATTELKNSLQDVNLSNARLLYTNRVLRNTSLNERQKETIVEAISRAGSVTEARTIFDTLQSTAQSTPKRGPQSLSEAINRRSKATVIRASRSEKPSSDPFQERMKRLAGIK